MNLCSAKNCYDKNIHIINYAQKLYVFLSKLFCYPFEINYSHIPHEYPSPANLSIRKAMPQNFANLRGVARRWYTGLGRGVE